MVCPDCKHEFDPDEEAIRFQHIVEDLDDWYHPYSRQYCAECDYKEACAAEGGLED